MSNEITGITIENVIIKNWRSILSDYIKENLTNSDILKIRKLFREKFQDADFEKEFLQLILGKEVYILNSSNGEIFNEGKAKIIKSINLSFTGALCMVKFISYNEKFYKNNLFARVVEL